MKLNRIEHRILGYLDQHGGRAHRYDLICALSSPESRIGSGVHNGSNAGIPRLMGAWARRLIRAGLVLQCSRWDGFYSHHEITAEGRAAMRALQT